MTIISQDGMKVYANLTNALVDIAEYEKQYSIGVNGISVGLYSSKEVAIDILKKIACSDTDIGKIYKMPLI